MPRDTLHEQHSRRDRSLLMGRMGLTLLDVFTANKSGVKGWYTTATTYPRCFCFT